MIVIDFLLLSSTTMPSVLTTEVIVSVIDLVGSVTASLVIVKSIEVVLSDVGIVIVPEAVRLVSLPVPVPETV